jgi:copper chaperone NosL
VPLQKKDVKLSLFIFAVIMSLIISAVAGAQVKESLKPGPMDKCPVCGMFVAKYPDFIAMFSFKDGGHVFFDGVKDMMWYYLELQKYDPSKKPEDIVDIRVTDYYGVSGIDGAKAFYVSGSDIYGPMGKELIPFEKEQEAKEFMKDHKGKAIFGFKDIHRDTLKALE